MRELDHTDRRILDALLRDGRITNNQLAERLNLSPSSCWQRVKRLEREGCISSYTAVVDQAFLGAPETVIVEVVLDRHDDVAIEEFGDAVSRIPEVLEVYLVSGEYDYLLKVAVSSTMGYEEFLRTRLYKIKGIRHSRSLFALRCLKRAVSVSPLGIPFESRP